MSQNNYVLVEWPWVQDLMEESWFANEAILNHEISSAYFIPEERIMNNDYILRRCEELAKQLVSTTEEELFIYEEWNNGSPFEGGMNTFESILNLKLNTDEM
jgi:hypothetical protein